MSVVLDIGDSVNHLTFGPGEVTGYLSRDGMPDLIFVHFEDGKTRKFPVDTDKLERVKK